MNRILGRYTTLALLGTLIVGFGLGCGSDKSTEPEPEPEPYSRIETLAGTGEPGLGTDGLAPLEVQFYLPQDLTFGPDGLPYILDWNNHRVRILEDNKVQTVIGTGELGDAPAGPALETSLNHPTHVSFDPLGNLILSAWHNSMILRMNMSTRWIEPICGDGQRDFGGDGGPAEDAVLDLPSSTAFDSDGRMYISDQANFRVRMVDESGIIQTVIGTGVQGFGGDGGPAIDAQVSWSRSQSAPPMGRIEFDAHDNLYIADTVNNRVRMVDTNGIIHTVAGNGTQGFSGDGGLATEASLNWPSDVAISPEGLLYIADTRNHAIRKVDENGIITTVAGQGRVAGYSGDGGRPEDATLNRPYGITFDPDGNLYIADTHNHVIRVVPK